MFTAGKSYRSEDLFKGNKSRTPFFQRNMVQAKLQVNEPGDKYEQQADAMADHVMRMNTSSTGRPAFFSPAEGIQRKCQQCEEEEKHVQRKENSTGKINGNGQLDNYINTLGSSGEPLTQSNQHFFESRFGSDFSDVRLHTDSAAAKSAQSINALAYTSGNNIVFNSNQYAPESEGGKRLMAHELTHVVQQKQGAENTIQRYSHDSSCKEDDLKSVIWPGDYAARQLTENAIRVLGASPSDPILTPLYNKYFMTSSPDISKILGVYNKVKAAFDKNNYEYKCINDGCDYYGEVTTLPLIGGLGDIRLCVGTLNGKSSTCIGRTILHEFTHYYKNTDDKGYCKNACEFSSCPSTLSASDAVDNADSFACFAYELYSTKI